MAWKRNKLRSPADRGTAVNCLFLMTIFGIYPKRRGFCRVLTRLSPIDPIGDFRMAQSANALAAAGTTTTLLVAMIVRLRAAAVRPVDIVGFGFKNYDAIVNRRARAASSRSRLGGRRRSAIAWHDRRPAAGLRSMA